MGFSNPTELFFIPFLFLTAKFSVSFLMRNGYSNLSETPQSSMRAVARPVLHPVSHILDIFSLAEMSIAEIKIDNHDDADLFCFFDEGKRRIPSFRPVADGSCTAKPIPRRTCPSLTWIVAVRKKHSHFLL